MKKRATALLLILLMVVSLMPALGAGALAAEKTIDITPSTDNPTESVSIEVGDTLVINVKNASSSQNYTFTVTINSNSTGQFVATGLADGSIDITITNGNTYSERKAVIHVIVGDGGSAPVDPPAGNTVDITPESSGSPSVSASIAVDETLTINVKNGSSSSTYTFTATLSNTDVAELQGSSSVSIAAGATGQFTVKGLADGTVSIVIQSNGQYSTRKGTINLTVGEGGSTPVDPPAGDTISITPDATNIPQESITIDVNDAFTIKVTNNSSRSGYDFTATASKSGVVEIQPSSVNIAAGSTGTFTVTGLTDGTVDITISNNNSSSERKGIIHVTVGDGGSTPVDPQADKTVNITPDADNIPEEEVSLGIGETLAINVTNASTRSGYDFTATTSKSGVVEIKSTSVNIAASSTGTFIVTGLTDGTVDITISNNNSNSERKATIHVTVGTGGSEEPPIPGEDKTYVQADTLEDGKNYLIVNGNSGSVYVLGNETTGSGNNTGLKGIAATVENGKITLSAANAAKAEFTAESKTSVSGAVSAWLEQGGKYLYTASSNGLRISDEQTTSSNSGKFWHYKAEEKNLLWFFKDTDSSDGYTDTSNTYKYYLNCNSGTFTATNVSSTSLANTTTPAIYLFVEDETTEPEIVPVTGVTLNKSTMALTVGGTGTLSATVAPDNATNKNVTWNSSNTDVATVDNSGKVTAVAVGEAVITVTTEEGEKTATCSVTVTAPAEIEFSVIELTKLNNSSVWMIQVEEEAGKGITYKGDAMVWSSRYEAYVIAVEGATKPAPVAADFATTGDTAAAVEYPAANDANGSKKVDMADVQYIYNLYNGKYETLAAAGGLTKVLGADINGDGVIDSKDATPILTALREAQA